MRARVAILVLWLLAGLVAGSLSCSSVDLPEDQMFPLTLVSSGGGSVASDPVGIDCRADCLFSSIIAPVDSTLTLVAIPNPGGFFVGWGGDCAGATGTRCTVTMSAERNVTVAFSNDAFTLTAAKAGSGTGTITSAPEGIVCGPACNARYPRGAVVRLSAEPDEGSFFAGWTGACEGTGDCTLLMGEDRTAIATFSRSAFLLTIEKVGDGTGVVTSNPSGIACGSTCGYEFDSNAMVTLSAVAEPGSTFAGWEGGICTGVEPCTVTMTEALSVRATFVVTTYLLTVLRNLGGTVVSAPAGIDCGAHCAASFASGTRVVLTATPTVGAAFAGWSGPGVSCADAMTCEVLIDAAKTVSARFAYPLIVRKTGTGEGTIRSAPTGIACGSTCSGRFDTGTVVTLTAEPASNSSFVGWSGGCDGSEVTCTLTLIAARSATATFAKVSYSLVVQRAGNGSGSVHSLPSGINCGSVCSSNFDASSSVTLTATPNSGTVFAGWTGACTGTDSTCTVTMSSVQVAGAVFSKLTYALTLNRIGAGTVTSQPFGIFCGPLCSTSFDLGTAVTLTATPDSGTTFTGWGGACVGTASTCTVNLDEAKTVNATFTSASYTLTVTRAGSGDGLVVSTPAGIDCGSTCSATYPGNTVVTVSAPPGAGSTFLGWSGACAGAGDCVVSMTGARQLTATFNVTAFPLTVTRSGTGGGTVRSTPAGIDCGATCSASFPVSASVSLVATPDSTSSFDGWSGACIGTGTCTVPLTAARAVTATFTKQTYQVQVSTASGGGSITSSPFGIFCGTLCDYTFEAGQTVRLTATPDPTGTFAGWSGACTGTGACSLLMSAPRSVSARFTFPLSVSRLGTGSGTVASSLGGISCGTTCHAELDAELDVTLTATPDATSVFAGWSGACTGTAPCTVTMALATSVSATFNNNVVGLNVSRTGTGSGTITSAPTGINCGAQCSAGYLFGTQLTLTATPSSGSVFAGWSGACEGSGPCALAMNGARTVSATFTRSLNRLTVTTGAGGGTVTSEPTAIYCGASCLNDFDAGAVVTLTATPDVTATFVGWEGDCTGSGGCVVTMSAARTVTARFRYPLSITKAGAGQGTVASAPAGINCGATCSASFDNATGVRLSATPTAGATFTGWSGACVGLADCNVSMDSAQQVTATFARSTNALTVSLTGNGVGTVVSSPTGISCGSTCSNPFDVAATVTLTATPEASSTFAGWAGACTGTGNCVVTLEAARLVSATFTLRTFSLTVTRTGRGTVTGDTGGIFCGAACSSTVNANTTVTLTASADLGAVFSGWSGACSGANAACTVSMTASRSVTATFTTNTFALTVTPAGTGEGAVSSAPAGVICGAACGASFDSGTVVVLSATPSATSFFAGWGGACSGVGSCTLTMTAARSVTATFTRDSFALSVSQTGTGGGRVAATTPVGLDCGATCVVSYDSGTAVSLHATPDASSTFAGWAGVCSGTADCALTLNAAASVSATFTRKTFALGVTRTGPGAVTSMPARIYCGAACTDSFEAATVVTLTATPDSNASFVNWGGACAGSATTCSVTLDQARTVSAVFQVSSLVLTVSKLGTGDGTVISTPAGLACGGACTVGFDAGTVVTLTAAPDASSLFTGWGGVCAGSGACTVTVSQARAVTATFARNTFLLSVSKTGTGAGTVTSGPSGINCGASCASAFSAGSSVTLTAAAAAGSTFAGWSGACTGTASTCSVTVEQAKSVSASFSASAYSLSVSTGAGGGVVSSDPVGIYCGASCSSAYSSGTVVTLTATADVSAAFAGWSGACANTTGPCTVTVDGAKTVSARFTFRLTTGKGGLGGGAISSSPAAISCGTTCGASFDNLSVVTLTAAPDTTSTFAGWSGVCSGVGSCTVLMDTSKSVTATFDRASYTLTVSKLGSGTGTVSASPAGVACGGACSASYDAATVVSLTAVADASSTFAGWAGACTGTGACNVGMDLAQGVSATFTRRTVTLSVSRTGRGLVTSSAGGLYCGAACSGVYDAGSTVTLTAAPESSSSFGGWTGGSCTGSGTCTLTLAADVTVSAPFTSTTNSLTVTRAGTGGGTLSSSPAGLSCGTTCSASFASDAVVTLSATPDSSSVFGGWSGACSGTGLCVLPMSAARTVTGAFAPNTFRLAVAVVGTGGGSVSSNPSGISCGAVCGFDFNAATVVTLAAAPDANSTFAGWSGACTGASTCTLTLNAAASASATFTRKSFVLTVARTGGGTVTSLPTGLYCGAACSATFDAGTAVTLTASPDPTASFTGWSGACTGTASTCTVSMSAAQSVGVSFSVGLQVVSSGTGSGTVTSSPSGISCGAACAASFSANASVTLTAAPDATSVFAGWGGGCVGTATTCTLTLDTAKQVTATFTRTTYVMTVSRIGTGSGNVSSTPAGGVDCGVTCSAAYAASTVVTLTGVPDTTSVFAGWSGGGCSGTTPCAVTMSTARQVTATFTRPLYILAISRTAGGTVTSEPAGLYCGAACSVSFGSGTSVTLTATPDAGAVFSGWGGACSGQSTTCTVGMTVARSVSAAFTIPLTVVTTGTGAGQVTSVPAGIACGASCSTNYAVGTSVVLTATADPSSQFAGWSGACSGAGACTVAMTEARSVTAIFLRATYFLFTNRMGSGGGAVSSTPQGINCGAACAAAYDGGTQVTLGAVADANSDFTGWGGACSGVGNCVLTMDGTKSVTFTFVRRQYAVNVTRTGPGAVISSPTGILCSPACRYDYDAGVNLSLTPVPDSGADFGEWTGGGCSGVGICTVAITQARNVTARFGYRLSVTTTGGGTVSSAPPGLSCTGTSCGYTFDPGQGVVLTATASTGASFIRWTGACTGAGACNLTMDSARSVVAEFSYPLTVVIAGGGGGTVASTNISGIACGPNCSAPYLYNQSVTLSPTPAAGATFVGWGGACAGTGPCSVTMDDRKSVTATFSFPVSVSKVGTSSGGGTVSSTNVVGITCGSTCVSSYAYGTTVRLSATPDATSSFASWTAGPCAASVVPTCDVPVTQAQNVTARFTYLLTVTRGPGSGGGTVSGGAINCGAACTASVDPGGVVSLTAVASVGGTFAGWSGSGCGGTASCSVTLDQSRSVDALFTFPLTVAKTGTGQGTVASTNLGGVNCGTTCASQTATFNYNQSVTLSAAGDGTSSFTGWSGGGCSGSGSCTVAVSAMQTVTATFTRRLQTLTVARSGTGAGTVASTSPDGRLNCGVTCSAAFDELTPVTLTATPDSTSTFAGWGGSCASFGTGNTCTVSLATAVSVTAAFTRITYDLTVTSPAGGTISSSAGGIVCGATCLATYVAQSSVTLTATPATGAQFSAWGGACAGTVGSVCTLSMNGPKGVSVSFVYPVTVSNAGGGTITAVGLNCGTTCSATYAPGTNVTFSATVGAGATFGGWTGACAAAGTASTCTLAINAATAVGGSFKQTLSVGVSGLGTVAGTGIACPGTCSTSQGYGTSVTLTPTAATGWAFSAWSGDCTGTSVCMVTLGANRSVTATFIQLQQTLSVTVAGSGSGQVTSNPAGISCSTGTCPASFTPGTSVVLTAAVAAGSTFAGWSGVCTGTSVTCTVTLSAAQAATATFDVASYTLTLTYSGSGSVSVTPPTTTYSVAGSYSNTYAGGTTVTLVATPASGWTFGIWSGCDSMSGTTCTVTMNGSRTLSTGFNLNTYTLAVSYQGTAGVVRSTTAGYVDAINCGGTCSAPFPTGVSLRLVAAASSSDYYVSSWTGCTSFSGNTCDVTMTTSKSVTAIFSLSPTGWISACQQTGMTRYFTTPTDDSFQQVNIGFTFNFKGIDYTTAFPSTNGVVALDSGTGAYNNFALPAASMPAASLLVFWDDLYSASGLGFCVATVGDPGARKFVVTWDQFYFFPQSDGTSLTFSAILYETSNIIDFIYYDMSSPQSGRGTGNSATVGIQWAQSGTSFVQSSLNTAAIMNGTSIRFNP